MSEERRIRSFPVILDYPLNKRVEKSMENNSIKYKKDCLIHLIKKGLEAEGI